MEQLTDRIFPENTQILWKAITYLEGETTGNNYEYNQEPALLEPQTKVKL